MFRLKVIFFCRLVIVVPTIENGEELCIRVCFNFFFLFSTKNQAKNKTTIIRKNCCLFRTMVGTSVPHAQLPAIFVFLLVQFISFVKRKANSAIGPRKCINPQKNLINF